MQELFHTQKYIHVPNLLDLESCQEHVKAFKALIDQGDTFQDQQCPLSHSVGHCALFDNLLDELTPAMEKITGLSLFPTYAYARWYAPGDELKIHRDRPACEISATINLGFEGNQWPIYVGHEFNKQDARKIDMNIGDAVIYKGCELFHWREKYVEGQWQAQVFIHYVDQNGPNAEWKYDKRKELEHHAILKENSIKLEKGKEFRKNLLSFLENNKKDLKKETDNPDNGRFLVAKEAFSKEGCQRIINKFESNQDNLIPALLIGDQLDLSIRDTKKIIQNNSIGLGATLTGIGLAANKNSWNFHITNSNQSEYLRYDENGHFAIGKHLYDWVTKHDLTKKPNSSIISI